MTWKNEHELVLYNIQGYPENYAFMDEDTGRQTRNADRGNLLKIPKTGNTVSDHMFPKKSRKNMECPARLL